MPLGMSNNEAGLEVADAPSLSEMHESDSFDTENPPSSEDEESTPNLEHVLNYLNSFDMANGLRFRKVKRSKGYAFIQYTSQVDALLAVESMDHKGRLKNGNIAAIMVLSPESRQGVKEFLTEIRVISDIEHQNLVKLYGCCVDEDHRILVYNYHENNSLAQTLIGFL
ncbi:Cold-responsive protein kinase 1 [Camellia lanceoleosa]|nr:Cold-responsive protein kinase 1 [Camellia lanceoleosa]